MTAARVMWRGQEWKVDNHRGDGTVALVRWMQDAAPGWTCRVAPLDDVTLVEPAPVEPLNVIPAEEFPEDFPMLW